jgi:hypothetical protein
MKNMSWPAIWVTVIIVLGAGYFVGQELHLDHETAAVSAVSTQR